MREACRLLWGQSGLAGGAHWGQCCLRVVSDGLSVTPLAPGPGPGPHSTGASLQAHAQSQEVRGGWQAVAVHGQAAKLHESLCSRSRNLITWSHLRPEMRVPPGLWSLLSLGSGQRSGSAGGSGERELGQFSAATGRGTEIGQDRDLSGKCSRDRKWSGNTSVSAKRELSRTKGGLMWIRGSALLLATEI